MLTDKVFIMDRKINKTCCVCGDRAIGTNFGAVTCESCKAFFRRTAVKNKEFKCPFDNNCKINSVTRKFCQKCRLKKCYSQGMKKESILNEKEKQLIRLKIEENRRKRKLSEQTVKSAMEARNGHNSSPDSGIFSTSDSGGQSPPTAALTVTGAERFRRSDSYGFSYDSGGDDNQDIKPVIRPVIKREYSMTAIDDDVYQTAVEMEFAVLPIARPVTDYRNNFSELEGFKLTELMHAINFMREPEAKRVTGVVANVDQTYGEITARFERNVKKTVEFTKALTGFRDVCDNDQIALVKYGAIDVINLRSVSYWDNENDCWNVSLDNDNIVKLPLSVFNITTHTPMYSAFKMYFQYMCAEWDTDPIIVDLLSAIVIFNPNRPGLTHKDVVKFQQKTYMYLLQRYLLLRYRTDCESKSKFLRLMNIVKTVYTVGRVTRSIGCTEKDTKHSNRPFLQELFNIETEESPDS